MISLARLWMRLLFYVLTVGVLVIVLWTPAAIAKVAVFHQKDSAQSERCSRNIATNATNWTARERSHFFGGVWQKIRQRSHLQLF